MNNDSFYTTSNMKLMLNIFKDYMTERYTFNISSHEDDERIKRIFLTIMNDVQTDKDSIHLSIQDMNIKVLAKVKEYFVNKYDIHTRKPNIENLSRDKNLYGERPIKQNIIVPEANPYSKKIEDIETNMFDKMVFERNQEFQTTKPTKPVFNEVKEDTQAQTDFIRKLNDLQEDRKKIKLPIPPSTSSSSFDEFFFPPQSTPIAPTNSIPSTPIIPNHPPINFNHQPYQPEKHFTLESDTGIFNFEFDTQKFSSVNFDKIIIPNTFLTTHYMNVRLDQTIVSFVFSKSFQINNSRIYTILKPFNKTIVIPIPLNNDVIIVEKSNGNFLIEDSKKYFVLGIETDQTNKNILNIELDHHLEDLLIGDTIIISKFFISKLVVNQSESDVELFNEFINRKNGHEILAYKNETIISIRSDPSTNTCLDMFNLNNQSLFEAMPFILNKSNSIILTLTLC